MSDTEIRNDAKRRHSAALLRLAIQSDKELHVHWSEVERYEKEGCDDGRACALELFADRLYAILNNTKK